MKVRLSACGGLFWNNGHLVWDDYLDHRQFALADGAERVLRWCHDWRELESIRAAATDPGAGKSRYEVIAELFLKNNILVEHGSARHDRETAVLESWGSWGPLTRAFHFSTRFPRGVKFRTLDQQAADVHEKAASEPPPSSYKEYPGVPRIELLEWSDSWTGRDLMEALYKRRSCREFGDAPVSVTELAAVLQVAAGPIETSEVFQTARKTSPSGGGRHPTEIYACVRNVTGVEPGLYHYNGAAHELELIGPVLDDAELVEACATRSGSPVPV
ncbi:nitroreductase family protein [Kibdelosporangium phytohabitans]|uniref:nitroreductase family protein n=1 Tax=Kibdelosporangium phytohabitans TaxID=860235 RepID=UPI000B034F4C|nr:nitroreductase family protein [Kibdelosporangium phytohabitans]MBE1462215.1 hypothetical protein [Kibdelosporangium phytohabitans]